MSFISDPFELTVKAVQQVMPTMKHLEPDEWAETKQSLTLDGFPLIDWGFGNLLGRFLSDEALQFLEMGIGYGSVVRNWNAADALSLVVEYLNSPTEKTLVDGMQSLAGRSRYGRLARRQPQLIIGTGWCHCALRPGQAMACTNSSS